jgi:hypothetical protein
MYSIKCVLVYLSIFRICIFIILYYTAVIFLLNLGNLPIFLELGSYIENFNLKLFCAVLCFEFWGVIFKYLNPICNSIYIRYILLITTSNRGIIYRNILIGTICSENFNIFNFLIFFQFFHFQFSEFYS